MQWLGAPDAAATVRVSPGHPALPGLLPDLWLRIVHPAHRPPLRSRSVTSPGVSSREFPEAPRAGAGGRGPPVSPRGTTDLLAILDLCEGSANEMTYLWLEIYPV